MDGDLDEAIAGQSVTLTLDRRDRRQPRRRDLRIGRRPAEVADQFEAHVVWMHEDEMLPGRPYLMKIGTRTVGATIAHPKYRVDVNTLEHLAANTLELNEIGVCNISLDRPIPFDAVRRQPRHGRLHRHRQAHQRHRRRRAAALRAAALAQHPLAGRRGRQGGPRRRRTATARRSCGSPGCRASGKSTIANIVESKLHAARRAHLPARRRQRPPRPQP